MLTITTDRGVQFNVRVRRRGDTWGLNGCLTWDEAEPVVEFYDATHANANGFGPRGQFVADYYLMTLVARDFRYALSLYGSEPKWTIDLAAMARVIDYVRGFADGYAYDGSVS